MKIKFNASIIAAFALFIAAACGCSSEKKSNGNNILSCVELQNCPANTHCNAISGICEADEPCDACGLSEVCWRDVCYKKCATSDDCGLGFECSEQFYGCVKIEIDGDEAEAEEEETGPCVGGCNSDEACWSHDGANYACYKKCSLYNPQCPSGQICYPPFDGTTVAMDGGLCRPPSSAGKKEGEECNTSDKICQYDLVCFKGGCRKPCDAWNNGTCASPLVCYPVNQLEIGLCLHDAVQAQCSAERKCPEGFLCYGGVCVPGTACTDDSQCAKPLICQFGMCMESCVYVSCPSALPECDKTTGHCKASGLACGGGCLSTQFCEDGRCYAKCSPACPDRQICTHKGKNANEPSYCYKPPDCRDAGATCGEGQTCDARTGFCVKRCPSTCPGTTCCDVSTKYVCGACQSGVCSALNPTGPCPLVDQKCENGSCHTDPNVCVPNGFACNGNSRCCSATPDATGVSCCVDMTNSALTGICCASEQTCVPVMSICIGQ